MGVVILGSLNTSLFLSICSLCVKINTFFIGISLPPYHSFLWFVSLALKVSPFLFSHQMKPDGTTFDAEIYIEGYNIVRCDGHRKGGGVRCEIKYDVCFSTKNVISKKLTSSL